MERKKVKQTKSKSLTQTTGTGIQQKILSSGETFKHTHTLLIILPVKWMCSEKLFTQIGLSIQHTAENGTAGDLNNAFETCRRNGKHNHIHRIRMKAGNERQDFSTIQSRRSREQA